MFPAVALEMMLVVLFKIILPTGISTFRTLKLKLWTFLLWPWNIEEILSKLPQKQPSALVRTTMLIVKTLLSSWLYLYSFMFMIVSLQNLPIERFWGIVNVRVNFPIKQILVRMDNNEQFDIDNQIDKFCVSRLSCLVASIGMKTCIDSWNFHPISSKNHNRTLFCIRRHLV